MSQRLPDRRFVLGGLGGAWAGSALAAPTRGRTLRSGRNVPMELYRESQIHLPGRVAGRNTSIWLDSGAETLVLDTAFARSLGLRLRGSEIGHAVQGSTRGFRLGAVTVETEAFSLEVKNAAAFDLSGLSAAAGRPLHAMIGKDVFDAFLVDLDVPGRTATFLDAGAPLPAGAFDSLPLLPSRGLRGVSVRIGDSPPVESPFYLGSNGTLIVSPAWAAAQGLTVNRRTTTTPSTGIAGVTLNTEYVAPAVHVGSVTFRDVPISVAATWSPSKRAQANIGLELLGRFRMAVDHARDRLHLAPGPDLHRAFRKNRSGLRAQFAVDRLRVVHVSPGSPAERAGWKPGEEIVAIDGAALDSGFPNSPRAYWGAGKAGTTVTLSMADGQTRRLTLEDYF